MTHLNSISAACRPGAAARVSAVHASVTQASAQKPVSTSRDPVVKRNFPATVIYGGRGFGWHNRSCDVCALLKWELSAVELTLDDDYAG